MAAIQLNFTLRTTANVQTVHLIGSWDGYQGQLPLSRDPSKQAGAWTGTFRFQSTVLQQGQRYWYYYIMDGYHVSHDPSRESTVEPTTGRKLNILDVPSSGAAPSSGYSSSRSKRGSRRYSREVPTGRALSPSQIRCPMPYKPGQAAALVSADYSQLTVEQMTAQFGQANIDDDSDDDDDNDDDDDSDVPSLMSSNSRSSQSSSPSSVSSASSCCTCERYGITRTGHRVKLDCGGSRCGYSDSSSSCSSDSEGEQYRTRTTRRHGVVVRG